jgi:hypothetical protein
MNIPSTNGVSGSLQSAASYQRAVKKEEPVQFPADVVTNPQETQVSPEGDGPNYSKRLRAYATKIETRLDNALASRDLTPRQHAKIEALSKKFHALMNRLENAYLPNGNSSGNAPVTDMHKELQHLLASVNHVMTDAGAKSAPSSPGTASAPPADPQGGLDTVA